MNKQQAHKLLDEQREGIRIHPIIEVTKALWICGDLGGTLPKHAQSVGENGFYARIQGVHMAQGATVGE